MAVTPSLLPNSAITGMAISHSSEIIASAPASLAYCSMVSTAKMSERKNSSAISAQGGHSSGHERHFLAAYVEAVAPALPVDDGLPVLVVGVGIAIDGMLAQALYQCLANLGANGKVHVGNP